MKYILVLSALLAVAAARASRRSRFNAPKFGPAGPIKEYEGMSIRRNVIHDYRTNTNATELK